MNDLRLIIAYLFAWLIDKCFYWQIGKHERIPGDKKNVTQKTRSKAARNKDSDFKIGDSIAE